MLPWLLTPPWNVPWLPWDSGDPGMPMGQPWGIPRLCHCFLGRDAPGPPWDAPELSCDVPLQPWDVL